MTAERKPKTAPENEPRIYTYSGEPGEVEMSLTYPSGGGPERQGLITLRIKEKRSGAHLIKVDLTSRQFRDLLGTRVIDVLGATIGPGIEHIGKRGQVTVVVPDDQYNETEAEALRERLANDWEWTKVGKTNAGYQVTARRWIDDPSEES